MERPASTVSVAIAVSAPATTVTSARAVTNPGPATVSVYVPGGADTANAPSFATTGSGRVKSSATVKAVAGWPSARWTLPSTRPSAGTTTWIGAALGLVTVPLASQSAGSLALGRAACT